MLLETPLAGGGDSRRAGPAPIVLRSRPAPLAPRLTPEETEAHDRLVAGLGENAIWSKLAASGAAGASTD